MSLLEIVRGPLWLSTLGWAVALGIALGAAAAALGYLSRRLLASSAARVRRRVVGALFVSSLTAAGIMSIEPATLSVTSRSDPTMSPSDEVIALAKPVAAPNVLWVPQSTPIVDAIDRGVRILAAVWLMAALVSLCRLGGGLLFIGRMRRRAESLSAVPSTQLSALSLRLGLMTQVEVLESSDVDVPVTTGWSRPAILLPSGMTAKLDPAALELVLAHELAHIRRADYLWGLVQSAGDVLTPFSPGHRWLSQEGRRLCEDACDDEVVALGVEPGRYARVLEALARWTHGDRLPMPVWSASRNLAARIRRLVSGTGEAPKRLELVGAGVLLCAALAVTCLGASLKAQHPLDGATADHPRGKSYLPFMFQPEATGVPFRIVGVEPGDQFAVEYITITSVYPKRIVSLQVAADVHPNGRTPTDDILFGLFGVRSTALTTSIEPGGSARLAVRFIPAEESSEFRRALGIPELQMQLYPVFAAFEDGSSWTGISPPPSPPLTIPRALVSVTAPKPASAAAAISSCYDAEAHQTSEGGVATIREEPSRFVRCTNGRWVEMAVR